MYPKKPSCWCAANVIQNDNPHCHIEHDIKVLRSSQVPKKNNTGMLLRLGKANGISAITQKYVGAQSKSPTMFSISSLAFWLGASTTHIKRVTCKHLFGMPWVYFKKKMHNMHNSFTMYQESRAFQVWFSWNSEWKSRPNLYNLLFAHCEYHGSLTHESWIMK